jgi:hypothetical protein
MIARDSVGGEAVITHCGEVYNYRELRSELAASGHVFRTSSDTEVILRAYLEWGEQAADRLTGIYGLAIWDRRSQELLLIRDRFGVKPLYAAHGGRAGELIHQNMSEQQELTEIRDAVAAVTMAAGQAPTGWISQDYSESARTPYLIAREGLNWVMDWSNDDQPYWMATEPLLVSLPNHSQWDDVQRSVAGGRGLWQDLSARCAPTRGCPGRRTGSERTFRGRMAVMSQCDHVDVWRYGLSEGLAVLA